MRKGTLQVVRDVQKGRSEIACLICKRGVPNCTCWGGGCAKGTSQIAHRKRQCARGGFSYVQFGTSLLHIQERIPLCTLPRRDWWPPAHVAHLRSKLNPATAPNTDAAGPRALRAERVEARYRKQRPARAATGARPQGRAPGTCEAHGRCSRFHVKKGRSGIACWMCKRDVPNCT